MRESEIGNRQEFRGPWMRPFAIFWAVLTVVAFVDALRRGELEQILLVGALLTIAGVVVYAAGFRTGVIVDDDGILLRNLVRDIYLPWSAVTDVDREWVLSVHAADSRYVAWAVSARNSARTSRAPGSEAGLLPGVGMPRIGVEVPPDPAAAPGRASEEVLDRWMRRRHRVPAAPVTVTYHRHLAAVLAAALVVLAVALVL
jgi:hypothetical protein